ncbi:MAG: hypothetical protein A2Y07_11005 [Planctomycetes bacterium GWF2_50_10]|nr:MAG: hypothetical protein A2Y07_11005 [Planctomycetes bacterium GWF2_50_10]
MAICVLAMGGCFNVKEYGYVVKQNSEFRTENEGLKKKAAALEKENLVLKEQVKNLSGVNDNFRYDNLNRPEAIELYRLTGIYARGKDGAKELLVYIIPRDTKGDAIKAAGNMTVQLWNLAGSSEDAMTAQWEVQADKLKGYWGVSMLSGYYRLKFDLPADLPASEYMVKIGFTDFISGKLLTTTGPAPLK